MVIALVFDTCRFGKPNFCIRHPSSVLPIMISHQIRHLRYSRSIDPHSVRSIDEIKSISMDPFHVIYNIYIGIDVSSVLNPAVLHP